MERIMFCKNCGFKIPDGAKFCENCGAPVSVDITAAASAAREAAPAPENISVVSNTAPAVADTRPVAAHVEKKPKKEKKAKASKEPKPSKAEKKAKKANTSGKKKKKWIIPVAVVGAAAVAGGGIFAALKLTDGGKSSKQKALEASFENLCDMTQLGTDSYIYARRLTEQLLETDPTTVSPDEMDALLKECSAAWEATAEVSGNITSMAEDLSENDDLEIIGAATPAQKILSIFTARRVNASSNDVEDILSETLGAADSIDKCLTLAEQYAADYEIGTEIVDSLSSVYSGRSTSIETWEEITVGTSYDFDVTLFFSGEIIGDDIVLVDNTAPRTVRTLSNTLKEGSMVIEGTDVLVDIGSNSSTIICGSGSVMINPEELSGALPSRGSSVMSYSSFTETSEQQSVTFHAEGLSRWMIIDGVGGFTVTRGDKGGDLAITEPEITGGYFEITNSMTSSQIESEYVRQTGFTLPETPRYIIDQWGPAIGSQDVYYVMNTIIEESYEYTYEYTYTSVTTETITERYEYYGYDYGVIDDGYFGINVSLVWDSADDLDLHVVTPDNSHVYYGNRVAGGGTLSYDSNASSDKLDEVPFENIYFPLPENGHYYIAVADSRDRTADDSTNYLVQVRIGNRVEEYEGEIDGDSVYIDITDFTYDDNSGSTVTFTDELAQEWVYESGAHTASLNVSLVWDSFDDLDLHVITPAGAHIYYGNRYADGGFLDVTSGEIGTLSATPVENVFFELPIPGLYTIFVDDYCDRTVDSATQYYVTVTYGDQVFSYSGTIDGSGEMIELEGFDYDGTGYYFEGQSYESHTYAYYESSLTWTQAEAFCESLGGHLAVINSSEEQAFLESVYPDTMGWIGLYGDPNGWYWVNGEGLNYTNWTPSSPSISNGNEWYGYMSSFNGMQWVNVFNGTSDGFYCEWDETGVGGAAGGLNEAALDNALNASGALSGSITISMLWDTDDDLDLHVLTPSGEEIYYSNKIAAGGELDVDANVGGRTMDNPVENIFFEAPENGEYVVIVDCYSDRSDGDTEYLVRVTVGDTSQTFTGVINSGEDVEVTRFVYGGEGSGLNENTLDSSLNANGALTGAITVSMLWNTDDDLDLYVTAPSGEQIYYGNRNAAGGELDVDANVGGRTMDNPVENIYFEAPENGEYIVTVDCYSDRSDGDTEYLVRVTVGDASQTFTGVINSGEDAEVTRFVYGGEGSTTALTGGAGLNESTLDNALRTAGAHSGDITISVLWDSADDIDVHVFTPDDTEIYYGNSNAAGGILDVDANSSSSNISSSPVENVYFASPQSGEYWVYLYDYADRTDGYETNFLVRLTVAGESQLFTGTIDGTGTTVEVVGINYAG